MTTEYVADPAPVRVKFGRNPGEEVSLAWAERMLTGLRLLADDDTATKRERDLFARLLADAAMGNGHR